MIDAKMPQDISKHETKILGVVTIRQAICLGSAAAVDLLLATTVLPPLGLPIDQAIWFYIVCDIPILLFMFEIDGLSMEKYIKHVVLKDFATQRFRKPTTFKAQGQITKAQMKELRKQPPVRSKKNRELKEYR